MFKKLACIFLLLVLVGSNFSRYFIMAGFEMNRQYIADNLCENRKKPAVNCKGKCYLAKKLKQADEDDKKQKENGGLKNVEIFFLQPFVEVISGPSARFSFLKQFPLYNSQYISRHIEGIFRPPRFI